MSRLKDFLQRFARRCGLNLPAPLRLPRGNHVTLTVRIEPWMLERIEKESRSALKSKSAWVIGVFADYFGAVEEREPAQGKLLKTEVEE